MKDHETYKALFTYIPQHEIAGALEQRVMQRIAQVRIVRARIQGAVHGTITLISIVGFVPTVRYIGTQVYESGFADYASLFVSDTSYAFSHLKTVLLSMSESMPVLDIAAALAIVLVCGNSLRRGIQSWSALHGRTSSYRLTQTT